MATNIVFNVALLLGLFRLCTSQLQTDGLSSAVADQSILKYMVRSKFSDDPEVTAECFKYYIPVMCSISVTLRDDFQKCTANEIKQLASLNNSMGSDRYQIEVSADSICVRLDNCNSLSGSLDYFDCAAKQSRENTRILYNLAEDASEKGAQIRQQYHLLEIEKYKCQNASERKYVESTAKAYDELNLCLQNGNIPSTESPVTSTETTITTTDISDPTTTSTASTNDGTTPSSTTAAPVVGPQGATSNRGLKVLPHLRSFWRRR